MSPELQDFQESVETWTVDRLVRCGLPAATAWTVCDHMQNMRQHENPYFARILMDMVSRHLAPYEERTEIADLRGELPQMLASRELAAVETEDGVGGRSHEEAAPAAEVPRPETAIVAIANRWNADRLVACGVPADVAQQLDTRLVALQDAPDPEDRQGLLRVLLAALLPFDTHPEIAGVCGGLRGLITAF